MLFRADRTSWVRVWAAQAEPLDQTNDVRQERLTQGNFTGGQAAQGAPPSLREPDSPLPRPSPGGRKGEETSAHQG